MKAALTSLAAALLLAGCASVGTVDMAGYLDWLRRNGYTMGNLRVQ